MRYIFLAVLCICLVGCVQSGQDQSAVQLIEFDCGRLNYDSLEPLGFPDSETDVRTLITPCYVIEHEKGTLLWDGGFESSLAELADWQEMEGGWRIRLDEPFHSQLQEFGLSMADFNFVAFSHFHFDHVGVANEVDGAQLLIQRLEYDDAFADSVVIPGFIPSLYSRYDDSNTIILDGDYDVFGDGRVKLISTPGHTRGHQSLFVDLPNTGPVILTGDLHILRAGQQINWIPYFNADSAQTASSFQKVEDLIDRYEAELWIAHDLERFDSLQSVSRRFN